MDRDAGRSDRSDETLQEDTGMIGSESEEPGPGRDTSLTDPDPVAASTDQPRATVAMSEGDPMRTRLGSHVEGAGVIGHDVVAAEEGATQETPAEDRPGYEAERPAGEGPVATAATTAPGAYERVEDVGPSDSSFVVDHPAATGDTPVTYTGEEVDVTGRPPGPREPGVREGVYDQEADEARRQRPSDDL